MTILLYPPTNSRHGGVGLFFKNSLPIKIRDDLSFEESIVVELKFDRKKLFFTVLYRSPAFHHTSPEFLDFLSNFTNLYSKIKNENPYASFFTGDFNGHSQLWWPLFIIIIIIIISLFSVGTKHLAFVQ